MRLRYMRQTAFIVASPVQCAIHFLFCLRLLPIASSSLYWQIGRRPYSSSQSATIVMEPRQSGSMSLLNRSLSSLYRSPPAITGMTLRFEKTGATQSSASLAGSKPASGLQPTRTWVASSSHSCGSLKLSPSTEPTLDTSGIINSAITPVRLTPDCNI